MSPARLETLHSQDRAYPGLLRKSIYGFPSSPPAGKSGSRGKGIHRMFQDPQTGLTGTLEPLISVGLTGLEHSRNKAGSQARSAYV